MNKAHLLHVIFTIVQVLALIPLTAEIFGKMDPDIISTSAVVFGIGII